MDRSRCGRYAARAMRSFASAPPPRCCERSGRAHRHARLRATTCRDRRTETVRDGAIRLPIRDSATPPPPCSCANASLTIQERTLTSWKCKSTLLRMASRKKRPDPVEIVDPAAMRALAHPLKWTLMDALLVEGQATSTRYAELVGESQANCSFHLRQLARYGLVEAAPTDVQEGTAVAADNDRPIMVGDPARRAPDTRGRRTRARLRRTRDDEAHAVGAHGGDLSETWRAASLRSAAQTWLTDAELADLGRQITELMLTYKDRLH